MRAALLFILYSLAVFVMASSAASSADLVWQKCLGGSSWEYAWGAQPTADGGYILAGATDSNEGDMKGLRGDYGCWAVRLGVDARFMSSYEDLLRSQSGLMVSYESLLKNTTLDSSMSYWFLDSFDDLAERQQRGLYSFEDLGSNRWSDLDACQKIQLTDSYEDLLRRQAAMISSNEDLLKRGFCKLGAENRKELLDRFESRLKLEAVLLKKLEDWLAHQQMMETTEYDTWLAFLSSFEDLLRRQSNLLDSFEVMMKIDCTGTYLALNKTALPASVNAGDDVEYSYAINATGPYDIENIIVKDSLWGEVGTIDNLSPGIPKTMTITRYPSCADCNNCTCKVCNFATACGEVITDSGNFTVCDVSNDACAIVSESVGTSPFYPGGKLAAAEGPAPAAWNEEADGKPISNDGVPVTIYLDRYPGQSSEPEAFDVYVDGEYIGRGSGDSFSFSVSGGYHDISVKDGRHEYRRMIFFQRGVPKKIFVYLE